MTNLRKKAWSSTDQIGDGEFDYQQCSFLSESNNFQIVFFFFLASILLHKAASIFHNDHLDLYGF